MGEKTTHNNNSRRARDLQTSHCIPSYHKILEQIVKLTNCKCPEDNREMGNSRHKFNQEFCHYYDKILH